MHLVGGAEGSEQRQRRHSRGRQAAAASAATTRLCGQHRLLHSTLRAQCRRGLNKLSAARRPLRGEARLSIAKLGAKRRGSALAELVADYSANGYNVTTALNAALDRINQLEQTVAALQSTASGYGSGDAAVEA